jgi:hypothetical protein
VRYVTCMGELFAMTNKKYKKLLQSIVDEKFQDDLLEKSLGQVVNVTDMQPEWAKHLLEELEKHND